MQQAIYTNISIQKTNEAAKTAANAPRMADVLRWVSRSWDLVGVVALMGSSVAYGVFALAHLGL